MALLGASVGRRGIQTGQSCPEDQQPLTGAMTLLRLGMTPIREIKLEEIRGVLYLQTIKKGQVDGVKFFMMDGSTHTYHGEDVAPALALAKQKFRPEPDETWVADQPVKE